MAFHRHFRVVDCSRHLGLPVGLACFVLALITGAMQVFSLYFLYNPWNYIMMGYVGATALIGVGAWLTGFRIFTTIYLLAETLSLIPVGFVIGYVSYILNYYNYCSSPFFYCALSDYEMWLLGQDEGLLWTADIVACLSYPFTIITLAGFRKLRLHQAGVSSAVRHGRGLHPADEVVVESHHHHHDVAIVQQPVMFAQPTVIAQPAPVYMQAQSNIYPQLQPPAYGAQPYVIQQTQPTLYVQ